MHFINIYSVEYILNFINLIFLVHSITQYIPRAQYKSVYILNINLIYIKFCIFILHIYQYHPRCSNIWCIIIILRYKSKAKSFIARSSGEENLLALLVGSIINNLL